MLFVMFLFIPSQFLTGVSIALFLAPLWLPFVLVGVAWELWIILRRSEFIASQDVILLEIKPPRSVERTPLAMEAFFSGIHLSPGEGNWYARLIQGKVRPWWSLEIASLEGQVHFFIWTRRGFRRIVESQLYAQYPGAQIVEAPDYTRLISADPKEWVIWGCEYAHTDEDPVPIKTYVEYGLDKVQKEYEQVDPLANVIEFMGSLGRGENLWVQFIIRVHKGEKYHKLNAAGKPYTWKDHARELIEKIRKETVGKVKYRDVFTGEERETDGFPNPTKGQAEKIAAIERNVSKQAFDVGIRSIYVCQPGAFDGTTISGIVGLFKQFSSEGWNGFKPSGGMTQFDDYPWEVGVDKRKDHVRKELVEGFRRRQFYHEPMDLSHEAMIMSTEELATLFHIPSRAVSAPSLARIQSTTSEAPVNLPV